MKVLLINGSPREKGCTFTALNEVAAGLRAGDVESEIVWLGNGPMRGCIACGGCNSAPRCAFGNEDGVNDALIKMNEADGLVIGSPVHYAAASGAVTGFMDRLFYAGEKSFFTHKPAAAVVSCRRAGSTAALEQLHKYFSLYEMPLISSTYWAMVHGNTPDEVKQDLEGMQVLRRLGANMAYTINAFAAAKRAGVEPPPPEKKIATNFIR